MVMTFLPNKADATYDYQAYPDSVDFDILTNMGVTGPTGVVSGCAITGGGGMSIDVAAGKVRHDGKPIATAGATGEAIPAAHATLYRVDLVTINASGTVVVTDGTAAAQDTAAAPTVPADSVVIGFVYVSPTDTTIATNECQDKRRWIQDNHGKFNIKWYGAVGNGTTDDTTEIQATINACEVAGGVVIVPATTDYFLTSSALTVDADDVAIEGMGKLSLIRNNTTSVFSLGDGGNITRFRMENMMVRSNSAGNHAIVFTSSVTSSMFINNWIGVWGTTSSCLYGNGATWGLVDSVFVNNVFDADGESATVPLVDFVDTSGGKVNICHFLGGRFIGSTAATAPLVSISVQASNYSWQMKFESVNFEIPNAGAIHAQGAASWEINNCGVYDITTLTDHLYDFGKHASGLSSKFVKLNNTLRVGGTIGAFYDIHMSDCNNYTIDSSGASSGGAIDLNGRRGVLINPHAATIDGTGAVTGIKETDAMWLGGLTMAETDSAFDFTDAPVVANQPTKYTTTQTLTAADRIVNGDGSAFTITLPALSTLNLPHTVLIYAGGSGDITVARGASDLIDGGAASKVLAGAESPPAAIALIAYDETDDWETLSEQGTVS